MDWATNAAGDLVMAGTPDAYGYGLRCPVCKAGIYHRNGTYNRPHFAHYSGNSNRACELYHPGIGGFDGTSGSPDRLLQPSGFEAPALIWVAEELVSLSLRLRLPKFPKGYASTLTVSSSMGRSVFVGEALTRTSFVSLPMREPPAKVETSPLDSAMEMRIEAVLGQFRLSGNYFRATVNGGVLERPDAALELGEEYFYVSQRPLPEPYPSALKVPERQEHRGWLVYRLLLRDDPNTRSEDIADLRFYLDKRIVPPKPRVEVVWPPACRFDADGTAVFGETTKQLIVRTNDGLPNVETGSHVEATIDGLGNGCYQIAFNTPEEEAVVWMSSGAIRRLRFAAVQQATPRGVVLTASSGAADLTSTSAASVAGQVGAIEISVPSERLWRKAYFNGKKLSPLPNGERHVLEGPFQDVRFGAFGSVAIPQQVVAGRVSGSPWYTRIERLVATSVGPAASESLKSIRSKHQVIRWAVESDAIHLLPLVLSAFSAEVGRGIS